MGGVIKSSGGPKNPVVEGLPQGGESSRVIPKGDRVSSGDGMGDRRDENSPAIQAAVGAGPVRGKH